MEKFELIYAVFAETASPEEKLLFEELMHEEENRILFEQLKKIWIESKNVKKYRKHDAVNAFFQMDRKIKQKRMLRKQFVATALSGIAAGIIIVFGLFRLTSFQQISSNHTAQVCFQTTIGNRSMVFLPDGTKVWLNAQTNLKYGADFNISERNVELSGEGYFEVQKGEKPFIVNINDLKVKVYGTKFNISAYADDPVIATCLETGKVSILKPNSKESYLKPGELALYERSTSQLEIQTVNPEGYTGWRLNKIYLNNEPLVSLARKLERQYNITIGFSPANIGSEIHYSGMFGNESLDEILEAISTASGLRYQKQENHYQIIQ